MELQVLNLGLPTLLYGLAGLLWARYTEQVLLHCRGTWIPVIPGIPGYLEYPEYLQGVPRHWTPGNLD